MMPDAFYLAFFMKQSCAAAVVLVLAAAPAVGQAPANTASASAHSGGGTVEARHGESVLWNPALLAMPDASDASFTLPGFRVVGSRGGARQLPFLMDGRFDLAPAFLEERPVYTSVDVLWGAVHSSGLGLAVLSRGTMLLQGDERARLIASGVDPNGTAPGTSRFRHEAYSGLAVGYGAHLGPLPLLGHTWAGASGRVNMVHRMASGALLHAEAGEIAAALPAGALTEPPARPGDPAFDLRTWELADGRITSIDVGIAANPTAQMVLGVSVSNLYQGASLADGRIVRRHHWHLGTANASAIGSAERVIAEGDLDIEDLEALSAMAATMRFKPMVRGAVTYDLRSARVSAFGAHALEEGAQLDPDGEALYGLTLARLDNSGRRVSLARHGDESLRLSIGSDVVRTASILSLALEARFGGPGVGLGIGGSYVLQAARQVR
jgi:hypothetical protein